ncbi:GNAT family N-acetyltransferase [Tetragenococcus halophilus]|uniref:N-acetyltransferase domain-containing protein n=1 Tax=Tetragenococcus halophilus subsp. halophilus TaxID=1513897 RepID=A0A2H6CWN9_TETHA|nr:GNAT family N-acetyltransferase [Tetragenococcus halophilus]GBD69408.1 hypothetical protein TEHN7118_2214 [Tetragenococcus halophilus subsp. halophilus]
MHFREADNEDLESVTDLLANAFLEYPLFTTIEKDKDKRYQWLYELQYINAKLYIAKYKCFVVIDQQNILGVALLKNLQEGQRDIFSYLRFGFLRLLFRGLLFKTMKYLKLLKSVDNAIFQQQDNAWYLDFLAISNKAQGLGLGSEILDCVIYPYIKKQGGGQLILASNTELNRKFYKKNGFDEFKEEKLMLGESIVKEWSYRKKIFV